MDHRIRLLATIALAAALGACAGHHQVAQIAPPPPPVVEYAPLPTYATPGMTIPAALPDGSYPTPNQGLSADGATWHLRAALNVAALSCPGDQGARITAGYNALLKNAKTPFAKAQKALAAEYRATPGVYDNAMTQLYNFYGQVPARPAFCDAAEQVLASAGASSLAAAAPAALADLDRPFTDFYQAYDAWRQHRPVAQASFALSAQVPPAPAPFHRIEIDSSVFSKP